MAISLSSLLFFAGIWTLSQNAFIAGALEPVPVCKMEGEIHSTMRHIIHRSHNDIFRWMCILIIKSMAAFYVACIYDFFGWSLKLRPLVNGNMSVYPSSCRTEGQNFPTFTCGLNRKLIIHPPVQTKQICLHNINYNDFGTSSFTRSSQIGGDDSPFRISSGE